MKYNSKNIQGFIVVLVIISVGFYGAFSSNQENIELDMFGSKCCGKIEKIYSINKKVKFVNFTFNVNGVNYMFLPLYSKSKIPK